MELPALVTLLALLEYVFFSMQVGLNRAKYDVPAPKTTGPEEWERLYRVHINTLEQLIVFLPGLWIFSWFVNPTWGAGIGVLFLVGRILYFLGYRAAPEKRTAGFLMGFLSCVTLVLGSLGSLVWGLVG